MAAGAEYHCDCREPLSTAASSAAEPEVWSSLTIAVSPCAQAPRAISSSFVIGSAPAKGMELFFSHPLLGMFVGFSIVFAPVGFVVVVSNAIFDINYKYAQFQRKIYNNARIDEQSGIDSYNYTPKKLIGWNRF